MQAATHHPCKLPSYAYERESGAALAPLPRAYRRREPEKTVLYSVVREHLGTFLAQAEERSACGTGYPAFIEREFRRYLDCGILARGFSRLRCPSCGFERLIGFSCKGRLCPSCWTRRAADTAAHLVDQVLPLAPYRQWVLTFPFELRFKLAVDRRFLSKMLRAYLQTLFAWQRHRGRQLRIVDGQTGAITFIQRFGSALNLNPHFHCLLPDGLFVPNQGDRLTFVPLPTPTQEELQRLLAQLVCPLGKIARAALEEAHVGEWVDAEQQSVYNSTGEALRLPFPRDKTDSPPTQHAKKLLCTKLDGFSLHAARRISAYDRDGLERLCRYGLRAPFSAERFHRLADGSVRYRLKRPWPRPGGRTELVFEPTALMRRLAALIPAPYLNLVRYHGILHNRSRFRKKLPPPSVDPTQIDPSQPPDQHQQQSDPSQPLPPRPRRLGWHQLLRRLLDIDALSCPRCTTPMLVLAFITDPAVIRRILDHINIPSTIHAIAPAHAAPQQTFDFSQIQPDYDYDDTATRLSGRSPPDTTLS